MRTIVSDFEPALREIDRLLEKYEPKHKGAWRDQNVETHLRHATKHIDNYMRNPSFLSFPHRSREDLVSAACRGLMALQVLIIEDAEQGKKSEV